MGQLNETTAEIQAAIDKAQALPDYHDAETRAEVFNDTENNTAGTYGHAEGIQTAAGDYGHAEGNRTSTGDTAHAEGYQTHALGQFSHTEGSDTEADGARAHAEGFNTKADAENSHAEGSGSHVLPDGDCGHAEGASCWVWSFAGHAEGNQTQAWDTAHAEGYLSKAQGTLSHAGGYGSVSGGYASFAHGLGINTTLDYEVSFGKYNANGPRTAFSIGTGTAEDDRKNALEVTTSGNTYLYGVGGYDGTNADTAVPVNQLDQPSRGDENMNECLRTGFYPWCTLGRPTGATGAFSLAVRRSTTPDYQGYYTVQQTAFGREAELGQVWARMVFEKSASEREYMDWVRVDNGGVDLEGMQNTVASHTASINNMKPNVVIDAGELRDMEDKTDHQAIHYAMGGMSPGEFMEAYKAGRVTQALVDGDIYTINNIAMNEEDYRTFITCSSLDYNEWYIFEIKITAKDYQEWLEVETVAETTRDISSMAEM